MPGPGRASQWLRGRGEDLRTRMTTIDQLLDEAPDFSPQQIADALDIAEATVASFPAEVRDSFMVLWWGLGIPAWAPSFSSHAPYANDAGTINAEGAKIAASIALLDPEIRPHGHIRALQELLR